MGDAHGRVGGVHATARRGPTSGTRRSGGRSGRSATSTSSASGSTVTVADDVWIRPWLSVTGTRCTRWGPPSCFMRRPHAVALQQEGDLVEAAHVGRVGAEHLELPAHAAGVALVHLEQVAGEEVGLLAALGAADLDDDVLAVVRVLRQQQQPAARPRAGRCRPRRRSTSARITSRSSPSSSVSISLAVARSPVRCAQLAAPPRRSARAPCGAGPPPGSGAWSASSVGVGEARLDVVVLPLEVAQPVEHRSEATADRRRDGTGWLRRCRQSPATGTSSAGSTQAGGERRVTGWASRAGTTSTRRASGASAARASAAAGTRSRSMPTEQATTTGAPVGRRRRRRRRRPGRAGWAGARRAAPARSSAQADAARVGDERGPQPALGRELVERVARGVRAGGARGRCRRRGASWLDRREVAVDAGAGGSRSAWPTPTSSTGRRSACPTSSAVDDAGDLEAEHLAAHDAVLDDHLEAGVDEQLGERGRRRRAAPAAAAARARRGRSDVPSTCQHRRAAWRTAAARRASDRRRRPSTSSVQRRSTPRRAAHARAGPSAASGLGVEQHPRRSAVDERGAAGERPTAGRRRPDCVATRARELGGEERRRAGSGVRAAIG